MLNKKQTILLVLKNCGVALLAAVLAIAAVLFFSRQINRINDSLLQKRRLSLILEQRTTTIANLNESFKTIGDNDQKLANLLPPEDNILPFVSQLDQLAVQNSLDQKLLFGSPSAYAGSLPGFPVASVDYTITSSGNMPLFLNFLKDFENLPFLTDISSLHLTANTASGLDGGLSAGLQAHVFVRGQ